jgi:hypothetical protein
MGFVLFVLATATMFLRPGELLPALAELPIYEGLMCASCLAAGPRLLHCVRWRQLVREPVTLCVLAVLFFCVASHFAQSYLGGAVAAATQFGKTALYYLLLVCHVTTPRRLRQFIVAIVLCAGCMVGLCVADFLEFIDLPQLTHYSDRDGVTITNEAQRVLRMRGIGIFEDPNDLALVIVATGVLALYLGGWKAAGIARPAWIAFFALMGLALLLTQSRGGFLAAVAGGLTLATVRYGRIAAILTAAAALCSAPLLAGRLASMDLGDGTGRARIELWRDGLAEISSPAFVSGIGMNEYVERFGLVAHNSFVHAFVELGWFGGTMFFGGFFFCGLALMRRLRLAACVRAGRAAPQEEESVRMAGYLLALLASWTIGLMSLSRCYVVPTYLVLGLITAYLAMRGAQTGWPRPLVAWDRPHAARLAAASTALLAFFFVVARTVA